MVSHIWKNYYFAQEKNRICIFLKPVHFCYLSHVKTMGQKKLTYVIPLCSWTALPNLPTARQCASAICVKQTPDVVVVVGGVNKSRLNCTELLYGNASQTGQSWRWRTLTSMHEAREKSGVLLLNDGEEIQRILVAGGRNQTAEVLKISCTNAEDRGQWTLIAPLSSAFNETSLVCFNGRILAFGR